MDHTYSIPCNTLWFTWVYSSTLCTYSSTGTVVCSIMPYIFYSNTGSMQYIAIACCCPVLECRYTCTHVYSSVHVYFNIACTCTRVLKLNTAMDCNSAYYSNGIQYCNIEYSIPIQSSLSSTQCTTVYSSVHTALDLTLHHHHRHNLSHVVLALRANKMGAVE